jgi:FKBP-type peptidyl-prolyl cis-trans isomerase FkpA
MSKMGLRIKMGMKKLSFALVVLGVALASCEASNPFNTGPVYDTPANLAIDRVKIDEFLATEEIDSLYRIHDPSGVIVIVQKEGSGSRPTSGSIVYTDYTGYLMETGSVFDTSIESVARDNNIFVEGNKYVTFSFLVGGGNVITGWDIGFRRLRPGSKAKIIIPSPYGYRDEEKTRIPKNSILVFDVSFRGID